MGQLRLLSRGAFGVALAFAACSAPREPAPVAAPAEAFSGLSESGLAYDVAGAADAPAVVLVHGTNLDRRMWLAEAEWLAADHRVVAWDMRGMGGSETPTEPYSNEGDLAALLDELGIARADVVGLSAGCQVALDFALAHPERTGRLVLASPSVAGVVPSEMPAFFGDLMAALRDGDFAAANEVLLASPILAVPPERASLVRRMVEENERLWTLPRELVEMPETLAIERLAEIPAPTLILVGDADLAAVRETAERLHAGLPSSELATIAGGGHLLNLTSPAAFRGELERFLGRAGMAEP